MAVNYNTDGITLYHDSKYDYVVVKNLKYKNGYCRKWVLAPRSEGLSPDELYVKFFEMLERGEIRTRKGKTAVRVLERKANGTYCLRFLEGVKTGPQAVSPTPPVRNDGKGKDKAVSPVIADPESAEAKVLVGMEVECSMLYSMRDSAVGKLVAINCGMTAPFAIRTAKGVMLNGYFIRPYERKDEPLELAKAEVRESLRGKWIVSKDGKSEFMVTRIVNDGGGWKVNGIGAICLMRDWTYADGSPIVSATA